MSGRIVVLLGPPGSGKTHIGGVLARRLGWVFDDMERWLVDHYGSREAVLASKDDVLASIEARHRARIGGRPLVIESTGVSEAEMLRRLTSEFDVAFVKVWASEDRCAERVGTRPAGGNLNNEVEFTREFHSIWEREVAPAFDCALELDNSDDIDEDVLIERIQTALGV